MSKILSKDSLEVLGCKLYLPLERDAKDYSGNSVSTTPTGVTYDKVGTGEMVGEFTSGDTITYADIGAIGTKLCWKNIAGTWVWDDSPTFVSSTGISGFIGTLKDVLVSSNILTDEEKQAIYRETYIE